MKAKVQVTEMGVVTLTAECCWAFGPKATLSLPWEELTFQAQAYNDMNGPVGGS